ncbi:hypothetical protein [Metabacillus iocasae]|uniref:Cell division protein YceG involved in septum cleavage n=1 Tax=Priestia iocasae TaxID=2291674 RepID=A0ABS2QUD2_9BACI|nr:hypothetical protein [Metabacillus iocasae]MBM7702331.1 cell division protein YceG involved in septum cleavage [Metabacillus iocasae]
MTPNTLRSFAIGLLVAATAMSIVYFISPSSEATTNETKEATPEQLSYPDMKAKLEDKGFVVKTQDEWDKQLAEVKKEEAAKQQKAEEASKKPTEEQPAEEASKKPNEEQPAEEAEEKVVYRTLINVTKGMTAVDVGKVLEQAKVVDSGFKFYKHVESRGVENELRPGTFEVESGMTKDEIIAVIFKK